MIRVIKQGFSSQNRHFAGFRNLQIPTGRSIMPADNLSVSCHCQTFGSFSRPTQSQFRGNARLQSRLSQQLSRQIARSAPRALKRTFSTQNNHSEVEQQIEEAFTKIFGRPKDDYINWLLEMNAEELNSECQKLGIEPVQKQIQNLQMLIDYVHKEDKQIKDQLRNVGVEIIEEDDHLVEPEDQPVMQEMPHSQSDSVPQQMHPETNMEAQAEHYSHDQMAPEESAFDQIHDEQFEVQPEEEVVDTKQKDESGDAIDYFTDSIEMNDMDGVLNKFTDDIDGMIQQKQDSGKATQFDEGATSVQFDQFGSQISQKYQKMDLSEHKIFSGLRQAPGRSQKAQQMLAGKTSQKFDIASLRNPLNPANTSNKKQAKNRELHSTLQCIEQLKNEALIGEVSQEKQQMCADLYNQLNPNTLLEPGLNIIQEIDKLNVQVQQLSPQQIASQLLKIFKNFQDKPSEESEYQKYAHEQFGELIEYNQMNKMLNILEASWDQYSLEHKKILMMMVTKQLKKIQRSDDKPWYFAHIARNQYTKIRISNLIARCEEDIQDYSPQFQSWFDFVNKNQQKYYQNSEKFGREIYLKHYDSYELTKLLQFLPSKPLKSINPADSAQSIALNLILDEYIEKRAQKSIEDMFFLAKLCRDQPSNKQLQNKFMHALTVMDFQDVNLKNITKLLECLLGDSLIKNSEQVTQVSEQGSFDHLIFFDEFLKRFMVSTCFPQNKQHLREFLDFFEFVQKVSPITFTHERMFELIPRALLALDKVEYLDLEDQIRIASLFVDKSRIPNFFFPEILKNTRQNICQDVDQKILGIFIDKIVKRTMSGRTIFEHMNTEFGAKKRKTKSRPMNLTELTIRMLRSIVQQVMESGINHEIKQNPVENQSRDPQGIELLSKVFSSEIIVKRFFSDSTEIKQILDSFIKYYIEFFNMHAQAKNNAIMSVATWKQFFGSMLNLSELVQIQRDDHLFDQFKSLYGLSIEALDNQVSSTDKFRAVKDQFDVIDLFHLNEKIFDLKMSNGPAFAEEFYNHKQYAYQISSQVFKSYIIFGLLDKEHDKGMSGGDQSNSILSGKRPTKKPNLSFLKNYNALQYYEGKVDQINSSLIYKESGSLLSMALELLSLSENKQQNSKSKVYMNKRRIIFFLQDIPNIRSIYGRDLNKLFFLINRLTLDTSGEEIDAISENQIPASSNKILEQVLQNRIQRQDIIQKCRQVLMLAATNLHSLQVESYQDYSKQNSDQGQEQQQNLIAELNNQLEELNKRNKINALDMYTELFKVNIDKFKQEMVKGIYNLAPLSTFMADLVGLDTRDSNQRGLQKLTHHEVHTCLKILNQYSIHQIDMQFLKNLSERYTDMAQLNELRSYGNSYFLDFAKDWPKFLKNELFIAVILEDQEKFTVKEQSEAIQILSQKNILYPKLLKNHFETFTRMTDKQSVKPLLCKYIRQCAYLGHTDGYDLRVLVQMFRRIFKTPQECKDEIGTLIDLILLIALENYPYQQLFDPKSRLFINNSLEYIEAHFAGTDIVDVYRADSNNQDNQKFEKYKLKYIHGIETDINIFNKQIMSLVQPELNAAKIFDWELDDSNEIYKLPEQPEQMKPNEEILDFILAENVSDEDDMAANMLNAHIEEHFESSDSDAQSHDSRNKGESMYDLHQAESYSSRMNEDLAYQQSRQMEFSQMNPQEAELFMFMNFDSINQRDINNNQQVKVWAILYHFLNKNSECQVFEEFSTVVHRNCENKRNNHKLYKLFLNHLEQTSENMYIDIKIKQECPVSGWPIDIVVDHSGTNQNFYFFLQEEMCYNVDENREQPLALQRLMMKHVEAAKLASAKDPETQHDQKKHQKTMAKFITEKDLIRTYDAMRDSEFSTDDSRDMRSEHDRGSSASDRHEAASRELITKVFELDTRKGRFEQWMDI